MAARDRFLDWMAGDLGVPGFAYGPERTLPEVRRLAFAGLPPDRGPARPHPTAGATAVGAPDPVLVAWNVWLADPDLALAQRIAREIRGPRLRALGLPVGGRVQVSMNLVAPDELGPAEAWDLVAERARSPAPNWWAWCRGRSSSGSIRRAGRSWTWRRTETIESAPGRVVLIPRGRGAASRPAARSWPGQAEAVLAAWRASAGGGCAGARARSCRPRCRTSRCGRGRTRGTGRARCSPGTPPWPRVDAPRSGKKRSGSTPKQLA